MPARARAREGVGPRPCGLRFGLGDAEEDRRAAYDRGVMYSSALRMLQVDWIATVDALREAREADEGSAVAVEE